MDFLEILSLFEFNLQFKWNQRELSGIPVDKVMTWRYDRVFLHRRFQERKQWRGGWNASVLNSVRSSFRYFNQCLDTMLVDIAIQECLSQSFKSLGSSMILVFQLVTVLPANSFRQRDERVFIANERYRQALFDSILFFHHFFLDFYYFSRNIITRNFIVDANFV